MKFSFPEPTGQRDRKSHRRHSDNALPYYDFTMIKIQSLGKTSNFTHESPVNATELHCFSLYRLRFRWGSAPELAWAGLGRGLTVCVCAPGAMVRLLRSGDAFGDSGDVYGGDAFQA